MATGELLFHPYRLDLANACLWRETDKIALMPKDFAVLYYLASHAGRLVPHGELLREVWPNTVVTPGVLKVCLRRIRQKLGDSVTQPQFIETRHKQGYQFIAPITELRAPAATGDGAGESPAPSLFPITQRLSPNFTGRESELTRLKELLGDAFNEERRIVFVAGEPGIGKTTLVEAFLVQVAVEPNITIIRGACIEHYGEGEAYGPVLQALERLSRGPGREQLLHLLRRFAPTWLVQLPSLVEQEELVALQRQTHGATPQRMLREMAELIEVGAAGAPLVFVLEDLHWSDYSTLDLVTTLARRQEPARLLLIGTYRSTEMLTSNHPLRAINQELFSHRQCHELELTGLTPQAIETYFDRRFPHRVFPVRLADVLYQRTEGNPLFLVNLIEDFVARGVITEETGVSTFHGAVDLMALNIPETSRKLIEKQSERLAPETLRVLEAASIAGSEFSTATVAAALEVNIEEIERSCRRLADQEQFLCRSGVEQWPDGTVVERYKFMHALYQQYWHEQVGVTQRQRLHRRVGERKEQTYGAQAETNAAELAVHFEQGREYSRAIHYLYQAGRNALQRSAYREAIPHFVRGLELLSRGPDSAERMRKELVLTLALGPAFAATKGFGALDVEQTYSRARELCEQTGETARLSDALMGLRVFLTMRGQHKAAHQQAEQLLCLARASGDPDLLVAAHYALAPASYFLGEFGLAWEHCQQVFVHYRHLQHKAQVLSYGQSHGVMTLGYAALALYQLGYPDQAVQKAEAGLRLARELSHPFSICQALWAKAFLFLFRREEQKVRESAEAGTILATAHGFSPLSVADKAFLGWAMACQGRIQEGIQHLLEELQTAHEAGIALWQPLFLGLLGEAYGCLGKNAEGLIFVTQALQRMEVTEENWCKAEIYRMKGELTLQLGTRDWRLETSPSSPLAPSLQPQDPRGMEREAEECFLKAIEIAQQQQAKSLELRAVMSLARLWRQQSKTAAARERLEEIYSWFTEGFDTKDLQEAKALLDELSH